MNIMHPVKLGFEECELTHILKAEDKETQTSNTSVIDQFKASSKLPLPRDIVKRDKDSVSVFEFCQGLHNSESPKSIIIVKETRTEGIVDDSNEPSTENSVSNKYRYCREVIKLYLKSYLQDCPDSEEQLIRSITRSTDQEYPDYQPCYEAYERRKVIKKNQTHSDKSSVSKIDAVTSYNSDMESEECLPKVQTSSTLLENQKSPAKDESSTSGMPVSVCDKEKSTKPKCKPKVSSTNVKSKCVKKKTEEPSSPPKEENPLPKPDCPPPAASCKESKLLENKSKCSICEYFGITDPTISSKPNYEVKDLPKTETVNADVKKKTMVEAHSETLATIKTAMEDLISKVYKTTHEAVTVITTESAKQLETFRKSKSNNTENVEPKASCENKTAEVFTGFTFLRKIESKYKKDDSIDDERTISPGDILERIADKVDSTISSIHENINLDMIPDMLKPSKFKDTSSPYDIPTPPKEISNVIAKETVQKSDSVFVTIKNRIFSMFSENDDVPKEDTESNSSNSPSPPTRKNSDEDLINRLIE